MGLLKKAEEALTGHHNTESTTTTTHTTTTTNTANNGPHNSSLANKLDPRVDSTKVHPTHTTTNAESSTTGPHNSSMVDPRHGVESNTYGTPHLRDYSGTTHNTAPAPVTGATHTHGTNIAKTDPRIDSEMHHHRTGGTSMALGTNTYNTGPATGTAGPHSSNLANKADPRIDSDMDNRATAGNLGASSYNTGPANKTAGPHKSDLANKADPRIDSDLDRGVSHQPPMYTTGPATTTAGPHSSNLANKVDPRVDSDMDTNARHQALAGSSYSNPVTGTTADHSGLGGKGERLADSDIRARHGAGTQRTF